MGHEIKSALNICSISFLVGFRILLDNNLSELPAGIFDSQASLTSLYVLLLVAEASFVSWLLQPDSFFFLHPSPARYS